MFDAGLQGRVDRRPDLSSTDSRADFRARNDEQPVNPGICFRQRFRLVVVPRARFDASIHVPRDARDSDQFVAAAARDQLRDDAVAQFSAWPLTPIFI